MEGVRYSSDGCSSYGEELRLRGISFLNVCEVVNADEGRGERSVMSNQGFGELTGRTNGGEYLGC